MTKLQATFHLYVHLRVQVRLYDEATERLSGNEQAHAYVAICNITDLLRRVATGYNGACPLCDTPLLVTDSHEEK